MDGRKADSIPKTQSLQKAFKQKQQPSWNASIKELKTWEAAKIYSCRQVTKGC